VQGVVDAGGGRPITGAHIYVLEAATSPVFEAATRPLATRSASRSLLTSATGHADALGNYVLSDDFGSFWIFAGYTCTPGHQVYLYARGGSSGRGSNASIGLMSVLGMCPDSGTFNSAVPFAFVNEVSTVATAYALSHYAGDATHVSAQRDSLEAVNLFNAFTDAERLARISTGTPEPRAPQTAINTLANILAACINSDGPSALACTSLFQNARGPSGEPAGDTATAAINIAHRPQENIDALYALQATAGAPFHPALAKEPSDFTLVIPRGLIN
jgi:hypothetical protein